MFNFNGTTLSSVTFNGNKVCRVFMNGSLVFSESDVLTMPAPTGSGTINLRTWIDSNTLSGCGSVTVINNHIQPKIISGNLGGLTVELVNNGEIQGNSEGANALEVTSSMKLTNNGWIRGAGGHGGNGGTENNWTKNINYWGDHRVGDTGTCTSPGVHSDRWWRATGGPGSGAWISAGCTGQQYWDINTDPVWGDQGKCTSRPFGSGCDVRGSEGIRWGFPTDSIAFQATSNWAITAGGTGGTGGNGQFYGSARTLGVGGSLATDTGGRGLGTNGFDRCTGVNQTPELLTEYHGRRGGNGGTWGNNGDGGTGGSKTAGTTGTNGGKSITGTGNLAGGSVWGNRNGGTTT